ncbi:MAG: peptidoglycan bridge formation glycyltransferase FemA/FemB family protein [Ignavibacteriales bacterium]|nr:peptidoglycan bridge formation glycyltransferase FemA/FemB family protein [Ignavibacteriales bacterium]
MKPKCRYNIRLAEKKGVTVRAWDDIPAFHEMMTVTGGRDNFGVHSLEYYQRAYELFHPKGTCELLVAEYEGKPLASLMVFANGKRAWYVYGASNDHERNRMPTYLLQWEAIRWAKARGCEEYDLWGVPDENEETLEANFETRHDGLWGVYRFKRGFGGELKRAAQALDRVYNPLLYWAVFEVHWEQGIEMESNIWNSTNLQTSQPALPPNLRVGAGQGEVWLDSALCGLGRMDNGKLSRFHKSAISLLLITRQLPPALILKKQILNAMALPPACPFSTRRKDLCSIGRTNPCELAC